MNHSVRDRCSQNIKFQNGYTLVEAVIAIAVCGFGLATILGLYGIAIKTEMVSKNIFEQSVEINSLADEIDLSLQEASTLTLSERVNTILEGKYPGYQLEETHQERQSNLYSLKILHKGISASNKTYYLKVFWRP